MTLQQAWREPAALATTPAICFIGAAQFAAQREGGALSAGEQALGSREPRHWPVLRKVGWAGRRVLFGTRFGRRLAMLAGSAACGQLAVLLAAPFVTRIYGPENFGLFVALAGLASILAVFASVRYEAAIPQCQGDADAAAMVWVVFLASTLFAAALALMLVLAGPWLGAVLGLGANTGLLWWLPPVLAVQGLFLGFDGWALYRGRMRQLAWSKVVQGITLAVSQLCFGYLGDGSAHGLFVAYVIGQVAGFVPILLSLDAQQRRLLARPDLSLSLRLAQRHSQFPKYEVWSRSLSNAAEMLPPILTVAVFGPLASGLLGLAQRIVGLPIRFLGISAAQVYVAELASSEAADVATIRRIFNETVLRLAAVGAVYLGALLLFAPQLFSLVFGPAWAESGELARMLAPMYLAMFINRPIRYTMQFYQRQDLGLRTNAVSLGVVLTAFLLAHLGIFDLTGAVLTVSVGLCGTNLVGFLLARALIGGAIAGSPASRSSIGDSLAGEPGPRVSRLT